MQRHDNGMMTRHLNCKFRKFKMANGCHIENVFVYLSRYQPNFDDILCDDENFDFENR